MDFEFDSAKDEANRFKHGLRLVFAKVVFADPLHRVLQSIREGDREDRFKAIGLVEQKLYTALFTMRGDVARIISVRRSNASEQRDYNRNSGRSERS